MIASHSGARALCDHSRNLDDELLLALKKNGGVAQAVALADYVKTPAPPSAERTAAIEKLAAEFNVPASAVGRGGGGAVDADAEARARWPRSARRSARSSARSWRT